MQEIKIIDCGDGTLKSDEQSMLWYKDQIQRTFNGILAAVNAILKTEGINRQITEDEVDYATCMLANENMKDH